MAGLALYQLLNFDKYKMTHKLESSRNTGCPENRICLSASNKLYVEVQNS